MEASTTIKKMLAGNEIFVPSYQRAYSWDTQTETENSKSQTKIFLSDLEEYNKSEAKTSYYFGHFLFEEKQGGIFGIIDGQQRLTTIVIFLSAVFTRLKSLRKLTDDEELIYEDMIKRKSKYIFSTVSYDKQLFKDYVIDQTKKNRNGIETESAKRIVDAFDFFTDILTSKNESYLIDMLRIISEASCTTHPVKNESEAIQMFIFQNNRGKKPSNLEIIKAQFMFNVHLYGGDEKDSLIDEIKNRFEKIYKSISSFEDKIDEDDVLVYTLRVYFNSLWESNAVEKIDKLLSDTNPIEFIKLFTHSLAESFEHLTSFFGKDERGNIEIHSLITLGGFTIAVPFVIKAYTFGLNISSICKLCSSLESLVLRHRLIGTRAELISRINEVYQAFTVEHPQIEPLIEKVKLMKDMPNDNWWWAYWNTSALEKSIQGGMNRTIAKFLLWKYENYLKSQGKSGYSPMRFQDVISPELEHIAPQTPTNGEPIAAGYCDYDEEFLNQYIDCLGNYLLISKTHNSSIGNIPFSQKRNTYSRLEQQTEIQKMTETVHVWNKELILKRKDKIIRFILENF